MASLFDVLEPDAQLGPGFKVVANSDASKPTRWMFDRVFKDFTDVDGNFIEQFQTTGFDARVLELYIFAYFSRSGFEIDRTHSAPDFIVSKDELVVAVETTTVNRSLSGVLAKEGRSIDDLDHEELVDYERDELPIRFGSPLFSKLKKKYWNLPQCKDRPLVLVIEPFHDQRSLGLSDHPLSAYLYGQRHKAGWTDSGKLVIDLEHIEEHVFAEKVVPSGFFSVQDCENISAVIFTNSGTTSKFTRMGYQHGIGNDEINIIRGGFFFNDDPEVRDSTYFSYNLDDSPLVETWGQGLVVNHNPNARFPIPRGFFPSAVDSYVENGRLVSEHWDWHPFSSQTFVMHLGEHKAELLKLLNRRGRSYTVEAISKAEFTSSVGGELEYKTAFTEQGWYADAARSFFGVIGQNGRAGKWTAFVLARNEFFEFEAVASLTDLNLREDARLSVMTKIIKMTESPKRIFWD